MRTRVTAILVAQRGGDWLDETITGLAAQTAAPSAIIAVNNGGGEKVTDQLMRSGADHVVGLSSRLPFGQAIGRGMDSVPVEADADDWVWLLTEDSCPEPEALARILRAVQQAPSVAVAGPKLVDWDHPERIIELGQSLTRYGSRWTLRRQELDQQQYDHMQDVLGVGPVGMLVRRDVWEQLGGFDPALPVYDDGLDFCVRARLAGHRVEVAPASRVRFAQSGVGGPRIDRGRAVMRAAHRQARTAQLHRRISYAPAIVAFFAWLGLPIYALLRVLWALIREQPGYMIGEFVAAFSVFFRPHRIVASRRRIRRQSTVGWAAIRPLRIDPKSVRTARMIDREAILATTGRRRHELHFISSGGLAVLVAATVAAIALTWWALPQTGLVGGSLAPLSPLHELWWNTRALDGVAADPFAWVLAMLGTLTFWNPSHAVVLLLIAAIPLTALGAWIWAAQLTESKAARVVVGLGFALSPVLLGSLDSGRLPTLVLTVVLPWLLIAATRCRESWSWAGTASLLAGIALAAAPVLLPAAAVLLVIGLFTTLRGAARVLTTAIVPAVLFAPKIITGIIAGRPLDVLRDPGIVEPFEPGTTWHMLLGFPEFGLEGWGRILEGIGLGGPPATLLIGVLMLPIALLALVGLFTGRVAVTLLNVVLGGLGMLTAIAAAQLHLSVIGDTSVPLWTGSGLAVYWIAVLSLAAVGATSLGRGAALVVSIALVGAVIAVLPLATGLFLGRVPFGPATSQMPALVQAAGENDATVRTLVLKAEGEGAVHAELVTGRGLRLDQIRTAADVPRVIAADERLAALVGGLASVSGRDMQPELQAENVEFVLLLGDGASAQRAELQRVFDQHAALLNAGHTSQGVLWRVADPEAEQTESAEGDAASEEAAEAEGAEPEAAEAEGTAEAETPQVAEEPGDAERRLGGTAVTGATIWTAQLIVLLAMVLLALPTGEVTYRPERRKRPKRKVAAGTTADASSTEEVPAEENSVEEVSAAEASAEDDQVETPQTEPTADEEEK